MFSLNETALLILCALYLAARFADMYLFRRFAQNVLWEMPWMKWVTFDELATSTGVPQYYLRRVLFAFMQTKFVNFELVDGDTKEKLLAIHTSPNRLQFVELFKYQRVARPKRKREKLNLPALTPSRSPVRT